MLEDEIVTKLRHTLGERCILETSVPRTRQVFVEVNRDCFKDVILFLKGEGFTHLSTITGYEADNEAIELLYHLNDKGIMLTIQVKLPLDEISIATITDIIPGALLYEREVHDLLGVKFVGHPDLRRLILPDDWPEDSYPMRKSRPTEKEVKETREDD